MSDEQKHNEQEGNSEKTVVISDAKNPDDEDHSAIENLDIKVESFVGNHKADNVYSMKFSSKIALSPLADAAMPIIAILIELKRQHQTCNVIRMREFLLNEMKSFNERCTRIDISPTILILARYILATVIDEFVLNAAWSKKSNWDEDPITSILFKDAAGGEKFFSILEKITQDPALNIDLIGLMYVCLSLGFEGKYHLMKHGLERLGVLKQNLYRTIKKQHSLSYGSAVTHPVQKKKRNKSRLPSVPWLKIALVSAAILGLTYFSFWLSLYSDARTTRFHVKQMGLVNSLNVSDDGTSLQ